MCSKWPPNGSHFGAIGHPRSQKIQKNGHSKKHWKFDAKSIKKGPQKGLPLSPGNVSKIIKIQDIVQMSLQASKMSSRASKITQNHENLVTQNQEILQKRFPGNKDAARWRVMRAAHWIYMSRYADKSLFPAVSSAYSKQMSQLTWLTLTL